MLRQTSLRQTMYAEEEAGQSLAQVFKWLEEESFLKDLFTRRTIHAEVVKR